MRQQIEANITLAREHAFPLLLALALVLRGWVLVEQGQVDEGIGQIRQGLDAYRATGSERAQTYMLALLAEAYTKAGKVEKGLRTLTEAFAFVDKNGERYWEAELYRLQGEFLLVQEDSRRTSKGRKSRRQEAEQSFCQALDIARRQHARSLELRATISLCRLWQQQDKRDAALHMLEAIYGWFTEGLDTLDLREAKALLDTLR